MVHGSIILGKIHGGLMIIMVCVKKGQLRSMAGWLYISSKSQIVFICFRDDVMMLPSNPLFAKKTGRQPAPQPKLLQRPGAASLVFGTSGELSLETEAWK